MRIYDLLLLLYTSFVYYRIRPPHITVYDLRILLYTLIVYYHIRPSYIRIQ